MAYIVYNNNGALLVRIPTGTFNTSTTSLTLIGRDVTNFGSSYNQNLITLLGNSANETNFPPRSPITGQLWWDKTYKKLKISFKNIFLEDSLSELLNGSDEKKGGSTKKKRYGK